MNRIDIRFFRDPNNRWNVEVGADRFARLTDLVRLVRLKTVECVTVFVRVNGDGPNVQLMCGSTDADRDFASIGNEQLFNGLHTKSVFSLEMFGETYSGLPWIHYTTASNCGRITESTCTSQLSHEDVQKILDQPGRFLPSPICTASGLGFAATMWHFDKFELQDHSGTTQASQNRPFAVKTFGLQRIFTEWRKTRCFPRIPLFSWVFMRIRN